jgi:hypothetical protein
MDKKMIRKPTFAGKAEVKDRDDIFFWAFEKTAGERLAEAWRLHCINHNIPLDSKLDKSVNKAYKR